ncbi:uncharacterized protein TrAtP1_005968 [Trichoderma atroviride]|uniref:uncharacterized protein n=1 Tax=Hypocrea atroviridis TaxID=63577 RepID=UPI0033176200|nr:hypothetical protein TrAtP1_005968 [Trichoderma atroviride]
MLESAEAAYETPLRLRPTPALDDIAFPNHFLLIQHLLHRLLAAGTRPLPPLDAARQQYTVAKVAEDGFFKSVTGGSATVTATSLPDIASPPHNSVLNIVAANLQTIIATRYLCEAAAA